MRERLLSTSLMVCVLALACAEGVGPRADGERPTGEPQLHHLRWPTEAGPVRFTATAHSEKGEILALESYGPLAAGGDSTLSLATYEVAFWAVQGQMRAIEIDYLDAVGGTDHRFLRFEVSSIEVLPGGGSLAWGDSVLITIAVDPTEFVVHMSPAGLQFDGGGTEWGSARLQIWYDGADGDLNGDGVVDETDSYIAEHFVGMWYQERVGGSWQQIPAYNSWGSKRIAAYLEHFSGYAVSW